MIRKLTTILAAGLVLCTVPIQAQQDAGAADDSWVHVRVDEADGAEVAVNLPISLVDVALEASDHEAFDADDLRIDPDGDITVDELRRMWKELRDAGEGEFVNVRDGDERVRVYRRGDRVHVEVDEDGVEKVRVRMPAAVVDALLGAEGDRLDLPAAARELAKIGDREVVRIDDDGTRVRIWVDRSGAGSDG
mgnify:CR=1 FL=1